MSGIRLILLRRGTQVDWGLEDPILSEGEVVVDKTRQRLFLGDGVTAWSDLPSYQPQYHFALTGDLTANADVDPANHPCTELVSPSLPAGSQWWVEFHAVYQSATAADIRFHFDVSGTGPTVGRLLGVGAATTVTATEGTAAWSAPVGTSDKAFGGAGTGGSDVYAAVRTHVTIGSTAGVITPQFAQRVSDASNTLLRVGTRVFYTRVA